MRSVESAPALLQVENLRASYGLKPVVNGVTLNVRPGEIVALLGPNGAGKSTLLKAVFGLLSAVSGSVSFDSVSMEGLPPSERLKLGLAFVWQGARVYPDLTVAENLLLAGTTLSSRARLSERVQELGEQFPLLHQRRSERAGNLSTGQRQLLAVARALVTTPKMILLDEPSAGLAPQLVADMTTRLAELNRTTGISMFIVEQNVRHALRIAHRTYVLRQGVVVGEYSPDTTLDTIHHAFIG